MTIYWQRNGGKGMSFLVNRIHSFAFIPLPSSLAGFEIKG